MIATRHPSFHAPRKKRRANATVAALLIAAAFLLALALTPLAAVPPSPKVMVVNSDGSVAKYKAVQDATLIH